MNSVNGKFRVVGAIYKVFVVIGVHQHLACIYCQCVHSCRVFVHFF